ncbi:MAG TPA: nitrile hydratase subunit beta [Caldimonas sp.]
MTPPYVTHADLGGRSGFGPVTPEPEADIFHTAWEPRALALTLAMGATGSWNIDMSRAARETLPDYANLGYYQIWLRGLETLLATRGLAGPEEIASGRATEAPRPVARVLHAAEVAGVLAKGSATERPAGAPARFEVGDRVRARAEAVDHHTRLPGYARGRTGIVERIHGVHVFADAHAHGLGEQPQWLYSVAFDEAEIWPDRPRQGSTVSIDAWEPYLAAA